MRRRLLLFLTVLVFLQLVTSALFVGDVAMRGFQISDARDSVRSLHGVNSDLLGAFRLQLAANSNLVARCDMQFSAISNLVVAVDFLRTNSAPASADLSTDAVADRKRVDRPPLRIHSVYSIDDISYFRLRPGGISYTVGDCCLGMLVEDVTECTVKIGGYYYEVQNFSSGGSSLF